MKAGDEELGKVNIWEITLLVDKEESRYGFSRRASKEMIVHKNDILRIYRAISVIPYTVRVECFYWPTIHYL